jgi:SAM-dependent MidA family methyltransferase
MTGERCFAFLADSKRFNGMNPGNPDLVRSIQAEIEKRGPQSFAWFMEQALYHPQHGYYSSGRCAISRKGDYFTNVSVGPVFGQLLAAQFAEMWDRLDRIDDFVIVEQGAHDGQFARDVLEFVENRAPEFWQALRYQIVEPFSALRERQSRTLQRFGEKVHWTESLKPFVGIHFSNELLDAMPVRLVHGDTEKSVDFDGGRFVFVEQPIAEGAFDQAALTWIDDVAANLERGYVIAIDYGRWVEEFQAMPQVRMRHRFLDSPFEEIGNADITIHVDWRSIIARGVADGLRVAGFTDQHHFLTGLISENQLLSDSAKSARELQTLLHPEMLGRAFQVLGLAKDIPPNAPPLTGFRFAREPGGIA